jgi:hypothetical protein
VSVFVDAPGTLARKAIWVLRTLCDAAGGRLDVLRDPGAGAGAALAYAPRPVRGVPTIPVSPDAVAAIAAGADIPPHSFRRYDAPASLVGAFPAQEPGFAVPFDLVASAFVLLAAWDERTRPQRDKHDRFPYELSYFATEEALDVTEPPLDAYVLVLRALLAEHGLVPPQWDLPLGARDMPSRREDGFAVALTHDVDNMRRWTGRAMVAAVRRATIDARGGDYRRALWEMGGLLRGLGYHLPTGTDPHWTFPDLIRRENELGTTSSFYIVASHHHRTDGMQPQVYRRRLPALLRLLRAARREVGLHGNSLDRIDPATLADDRAHLAETTGQAIDGIRFHYLRCLYHETLPLLEAEGFKYDSSLAFAEHEGPRCGLSFPFRPYCLAEDRPLDLIELPLVIMDGTLQERHYRGLPPDEGRLAGERVLAAASEVGGAVAILWHNTRLDPYVSRGYGTVYWDLVRWALDHGGVVSSAGEVVQSWRALAGEAGLGG